MKRSPKFATLPLLALAILLWTAGCKSNQNQNAANTSQDQSQPADQSNDAANANLAPISTNTSSAATPSADQGSAPAESDAYYQQAADQMPDDDDSDNGEQPVETAQDAPPPLPEYQQPPDPGDGYIWTPGYWNYASAGYYWVPGVWVEAPYTGALWTPGYWGYAHNHYCFFRGYWGPHIGFYGGVNYGFGYVGTGYQGGYWNSGHFYYNRAVNNINITVVHNVYERNVIVNNTVRVSFHGGPGGIRLRPRPAELVALREPHAPPMQVQVQHQQAASVDRAQFAAVNHGRPANLVVAKALVANRDVHPVVAPRPQNLPVVRPRGPEEVHPNAAQPARAGEPMRPEAAPAVHPAPRSEERPATPPAGHPAPQQAQHPQPPQYAQPVQHPQPPQHTQPAPRPQPPSTTPHPEMRPAPARQAPSSPAPQHTAPPEHSAPPEHTAPPARATPPPPAAHEQSRPAPPAKHPEEEKKPH